MKPSPAVYALLKHFEDAELTEAPADAKIHPKLDPAGYWQIGWGHKLSRQEAADLASGVTKDYCERLLTSDVALHAKFVNKLVTVELTQGQFDALVCFCYNLGPDRLEDSTLLRATNILNFDAATAEFPKWVHAGGKVLEGLKRRRAAEQALWLGKDWTEC